MMFVGPDERVSLAYLKVKRINLNTKDNKEPRFLKIGALYYLWY